MKKRQHLSIGICLSFSLAIRGQQATIINTDGFDDFISLPQVVSGDFTMEYWMQTTMVGGTGSGLTANWWSGTGIVDAEVASWQHDFGTSVYGNQLAFGIGGMSGSDVTLFSTSSINSGNWVHVAVSWKQTTGQMELYINGVLEASGTGDINLRTAPTAIHIGELQTGVNPRYNGNIDELKIWNYVRSAQQINSDKNCELNLLNPQPGLLSYYKFNQGIAAGNNPTVTNLFDLSGNNNTGTLYNFALNGSSSNWLQGTPLGTLPLTISATPTTICQGQSSTLSVAGASTYTWSTLSNTNTIIVSPAQGTSYTVTGANGTCSGTTAVTINVLAAPSLTIVSGKPVICKGASTTLTASGAINYSWNTGSTLTSIAVTLTSTTVYTVTGTDANGCSAKKTFTQSVTICEGFSDFDSNTNNIDIFPNPTSGAFTFLANWSGTMIITDCLGREVYACAFQPGKNKVEPGEIIKGIYFVNFIAEGIRRSTRIFIE